MLSKYVKSCVENDASQGVFIGFCLTPWGLGCVTLVTIPCFGLPVLLALSVSFTVIDRFPVEYLRVIYH
jgi:hypothetical protein